MGGNSSCTESCLSSACETSAASCIQTTLATTGTCASACGIGTTVGPTPAKNAANGTLEGNDNVGNVIAATLKDVPMTLLPVPDDAGRIGYELLVIASTAGTPPTITATAPPAPTLDVLAANVEAAPIAMVPGPTGPEMTYPCVSNITLALNNPDGNATEVLLIGGGMDGYGSCSLTFTSATPEGVSYLVHGNLVAQHVVEANNPITTTVVLNLTF
jgi:hypothetical protein